MGVVISEELLDALELNAIHSEGEYFLSLHAVAGTQSTRVIHLRALVKNQVLAILIDSGSTHTFLSDAMVARLDYKVTPAATMRVKVANGQQLISDSMVHDFEWWLQGHTFKVDARVLDIPAYDLILDMD
jgi:hypothetical protein